MLKKDNTTFQSRILKQQAGFTLLEMIMVLVLIGIAAAGVGAAVVHGMKGFVFVKENTAITQKAQLAMSRIQQELTEMTALNTAGSGNTCIQYQVSPESLFFRAIGLNNGDLSLAVNNTANVACPSSGSPGFVLSDRVNTFTLQYEDLAGSLTVAPPAGGLANLGAIHVQLVLSRLDNNPDVTFNTRIVPRNNGQMNMP